MGNDIFADYIRKLDQKKESVAPSLPYAVIQEPAKAEGNGETLAVLKDISQKLSDMQALRELPPDAKADLAIVGGMLVLPGHGIFKADIFIKDGKVQSFGTGEGIHAKKTVDASGTYVCPGLMDPHVHLGLFAPMETDMASETKAAVMGGITTTGVFFGGADSHFSTFPEIEEQAEKYSYTDIVPHLVIGNEEQMREIPDYARYLGVTSFKVYMNGIPGMIPSVDDGFILDVMAQMKRIGRQCILCCHTENTHIVSRALRDAKEKYGDGADVSDWMESHPAMAEEEAVMRISYLAGKSRIPVYLVHIGTKEGIEKLRQIKPFNKYVHIETTSPYLSVTSEQFDGPLYKMEPPLRNPEDKNALWEALDDDVIDTIGTDNVCENIEEKQPERSIWDVVPGYSVLETHLASVLTEGVVKRGISIEKVITHMTRRPAEAFGIYPQKGTLLPGSDADLVLIDMNETREVHAEDMHSRSDFSIFEGRSLTGWPVMTVKGGSIVMENGMLVADAPSGHMVKR
ncbi:dihydroorotase [Extibacter sp. GGCC_0201]|uniref:dihydroorotase n=1 Tax=Extibacter sp. GGCC_0201 TaxID=2731209 RepID=UPI001AA11B18|nr:amidohydrolase family protein [Extibacter sp. GGCC_0201]MBO1721447.1 amidohydrolase family protein [Extibacter sp. GGCC_0201]